MAAILSSGKKQKITAHKAVVLMDDRTPRGATYPIKFSPATNDMRAQLNTWTVGSNNQAMKGYLSVYDTTLYSKLLTKS
jgi:hypothetical protein